MPSANRFASSHRFDAIGTRWQIDSLEPLDDRLIGRIHSRIDEFDRTWSRFRDDSLVARIAREPGTFSFPPDAPALFDLYRILFEATSGAVSPLVGRSLELLGYDAGYSLRSLGAPAPAPSWGDAFAWDGERLSTLRPVTIDVGAAGKGLLVDIVCGVLDDADVTEYVVDAGGDLRHRGATSIRVALEHPLDARKAIGVATIRGRALCASATNRRTWGPGLHHIIDATTGLPTTRVIATWVVADEAMVADGIATALFFSHADSIAEAFGAKGVNFDFVVMLADGRLDYSARLGEELFL